MRRYRRVGVGVALQVDMIPPQRTCLLGPDAYQEAQENGRQRTGLLAAGSLNWLSGSHSRLADRWLKEWLPRVIFR
jgi:hypothetical protein